MSRVNAKPIRSAKRLSRKSPSAGYALRRGLEALEDRHCPASIFLDFDSPTTGSNNTVPIDLVSQIPVFLNFSALDVDFGVSRPGVHRTTTDPELLAVSGIGGMALSNGGSASNWSTGSIDLRGALGTSISFHFGQTGNSGDTLFTVPRGFTGYTYSRTLDDFNPLQFRGEQPEDVYKQFGTNGGAPVGPILLDGPVPGLPTGPVYFNSFRFTNGTDAGNVFGNNRPGEIQLENVTITYDRVEDIMKDSRSFLSDGGDLSLSNQLFNFQSRAGGAGVLFEFKPVGQFGAIPLADMAAALGVERFQFINRVILVPSHWTINVGTGNYVVDPLTLRLVSAQIDQPLQQTGVPLPLLDPIPSPTGREAYLFGTFGGGPQTTTGVWYVPGADNLPFYYNPDELEWLATIPQGTQRISDTNRLLFLDSPVQDAGTMSINTSNPRAGDYITCETRPC